MLPTMVEILSAYLREHTTVPSPALTTLGAWRPVVIEAAHMHESGAGRRGGLTET